MEDFLAALDEVKPAFGAVIDSLEGYRLHGMVDYGPRYQHLLSSCRTLVQQVRCCRGVAAARRRAGAWAEAVPLGCGSNSTQRQRSPRHAWQSLALPPTHPPPHTCLLRARSRPATPRRSSRACWRARRAPARRRWLPRWPSRAGSPLSRWAGVESWAECVQLGSWVLGSYLAGRATLRPSGLAPLLPLQQQQPTGQAPAPPPPLGCSLPSTHPAATAATPLRPRCQPPGGERGGHGGLQRDRQVQPDRQGV